MNENAALSDVQSRRKIQSLTIGTTLRNLTIFTMVVLASGWIGRGVDVLVGSTGNETLGMAIWLATPLPVSLLLRAFAGDGWKDIGIRPNFKGNLAWYGAAILIFPVVTALIMITGGSIGWITFPNLSSGALGLLLQAFILALPAMLVKDLFEEGAWRGYLAPKIHSLHLNDFTSHTIVGLIWGAWHIPYYLFFLPRDYLQLFTTLDLILYIPLVLVVFIAWAFVYGEIRLLTHSLWPALLMHAVEDAFLLQLFEQRLIELVPGTDWLISPMNGLLNVLFFIALGLGLRQLRRRKMSAAGRSGPELRTTM